jgi:hypothetical protein
MTATRNANPPSSGTCVVSQACQLFLLAFRAVTPLRLEFVDVVTS